MSKNIFCALLALVLFVGNGTLQIAASVTGDEPLEVTGTIEKMIAANGNVAVNLDLGKLNSARTRRQTSTESVRFATEPDSFFSVIVFNGELRGPLPGTMKMIPQTRTAVPSALAASFDNLMVENLSWGGQYEMVIRDANTGFTFFNVEGHTYDYNHEQRQLAITGGRVLISREFAAAMGRAADENLIVGELNINISLKTTEISNVLNGEVVSEKLPAMSAPGAGTVPGPDVVVGDLNGLAQFGSSSGTQVGLAVGTDSCNFGTIDLNWFANPSNDHPVIPQNLYRMSGGTDNAERFEQIGQGQVKHAFTALTQNLCSLGCNGVGGSRLGSGCSDPYSASLNAGPNLGSKAWINPFTGFYPRNDSTTPNNSHTGHSHNGTSHRILTEIADLATNLNPGATYFAEAQYVTPHEYAHCQTNPTQCNMYNNVSYRRYNVSGTTSPFSFSPAAATVRAKSAITAWTGATIVEINPAPGVDGIAMIGYKVTQTSPGTWHYEYAVYNQNLDRGIQSFSIPINTGVTLTNTGFRAPAQHPASVADGTFNNQGFSSTPWTPTLDAGAMTWATETVAQNQNANAIRWGTMYNFRFDSNRPPTSGNATVGFFKTGSPVQVAVQIPSAGVASTATIAGQLTTPGGGRAVRVYASVQNGTPVSLRPSQFGFFSFENLPTGVTYNVWAESKSHTFPTVQVTLNGNVSDVSLPGTPIE